MEQLTNSAGTEQWLEASKTWRISAYLPGTAQQSLTVGTIIMSVPVGIGIGVFTPVCPVYEAPRGVRPDVAASLERSLVENASVWTELANY